MLHQLAAHIKKESKRIVTNYSYRECNNADIRKKVEIRLTEMLGKLLSAGHVYSYYVTCDELYNDPDVITDGRLRAMIRFTPDKGGPRIQFDLDAKGLDVTVQTRVDGAITSRISSTGIKSGEIIVYQSNDKSGKTMLSSDGKSKESRFDEAMDGIEKEF